MPRYFFPLFGQYIMMNLVRKHKRQIKKHDSGFKAAESYHMDTDPISRKAAKDFSVSKP